MDGVISLLGSRTFWSSSLGLVAIIAAQFHWSSVLGFATDPNSVTAILNGVAMLGGLGAIVFRALATKKVTTLLPPASGSSATLKAHGWLAAPLLLAMTLGGCQTTAFTQSQLDTARASYNAGFLAPAAHYRQLGFCKTGTSATLAHPCADRAIVAKLRVADAAIRTEFNALQADLNAGDATGAANAWNELQSLVAAAQALISGLGVN